MFTFHCQNNFNFLHQWLSAEHRKDIICNIILQFFHLQQRLEISVCNHKIYICIVFHMLWIRCFWQSNCSQLQNVPNAQLCSRNAVFRCHFSRLHTGLPCVQSGNKLLPEFVHSCRNPTVQNLFFINVCSN